MDKQMEEEFQYFTSLKNKHRIFLKDLREMGKFEQIIREKFKNADFKYEFKDSDIDIYESKNTEVDLLYIFNINQWLSESTTISNIKYRRELAEASLNAISNIRIGDVKGKVNVVFMAEIPVDSTFGSQISWLLVQVNYYKDERLYLSIDPLLYNITVYDELFDNQLENQKKRKELTNYLSEFIDKSNYNKHHELIKILGNFYHYSSSCEVQNDKPISCDLQRDISFFYKNVQVRPLKKYFKNFFDDYFISTKHENIILDNIAKKFGGISFFKVFIANKFKDLSICDKLSKEIDPNGTYSLNGINIGSQILGYISIYKLF